MDDLLDKASAVPFSVKKVIVDSDRMRDCINDIRLNLPSEIKDAKHIVLDRKTILADANREAEQIIRRAEEKAKIIVSNDEITKAAKLNANDILAQAQSKAKEIKAAADKYIDSILQQAEESLASDLLDVKKTRQAIRTGVPKK
jgi:regulator of protease activity HflC (stomatin/prohibitin superfamily)